MRRVPTDAPARQWMVECFWPGVDEPAVAQANRRLDAAAVALLARGQRARRTVVTYVPEEETVLWVFEADGEDSLRDLARWADVRFDRVLPVVSTVAT